MINAGTVGAYLELDISQFQNNLQTAGQQLENFRIEHTRSFNGAGGLGAELLDGFSAPITAAGIALKEFVRQFGISSGIIRDDSRITGSVIGQIGSAMTAVSDSARKLHAGAADAAGGVARLADAWLGIKKGLQGAAPELYVAARNSAGGIVSGFNSLLNAGGMSAIGSRAMAGLKNGLDSGRKNTVSAVGSIMRGMLSAARGVSFTGVGQSIAAGIQAGLNQRRNSLLATAASIAAGIAGRIRAALKINSPSKVTMELGQFTAEGMELGLKTGSKSLYQTAAVISRETADALSGISYSAQAYSAPSPGADKLQKLLDAVERLADAQTTMEIDGRPFGRLVREYV